MSKRLSLAALMAFVVSLALPALASAQGEEAIATEVVKSELDVTWIIVSAILVLFMQAGFLFLEIGFSRQKNVGAGVAKIFVNLSIAALAWWAVGFGIS
ncbi:MAG: ammonium transporter, partial [Solirubrobacterales bacterium]